MFLSNIKTSNKKDQNFKQEKNQTLQSPILNSMFFKKRAVVFLQFQFFFKIQNFQVSKKEGGAIQQVILLELCLVQLELKLISKRLQVL